MNKLMKNLNGLGQMKRLLVVTLIFLLGFFPSFVFALPSGGSIAGGTGSIGGTSQDMVINQTSDKLIINWNDFSIGSSQSVQFIQPGSSSIALNRVTGTNPSLIFGSLSANGQIFIVNPSGIFFGPNSQVNVNSLLASTLQISNQDFLDGIYNFYQDPNFDSSYILNEGSLTVSGFLGLLAPAVINKGTIVANLGSVALGSAQAATVDFTGDGLINFILNEGVSGVVTDAEGNIIEDRVTNAGLIQANGGQVNLLAKNAGDVVHNVVNNTGIIEANTVIEKEGKIILSGEGGLVRSSGKLSASGDDEGEKAGTIEIYGEDVELLASEIAKSNVTGEDGSGLFSIEATNSILVKQSIDTSGEVNMVAANGIKLEKDLTAGGTIDLNSDSDEEGEGTLDLEGMKLKTTGPESDINITAAEMYFDAIESAGNVTFTQSTGQDLGIQGDDLVKISTNDLTVNTEGSIMVAGVTAGDTENIKGMTTLNAESVAFGIYEEDFEEFDGEEFDPSSTFTNGISVNALNGIGIFANLTSLNGGMAFNADKNDNGLGTFGIYGADVTAIDQLITITAADFEMASSLNAGSQGVVEIKASDNRSIEIQGDEEREYYLSNQIFTKDTTGLVDTSQFGEGSDVMSISEYELGQITAGQLTIRSRGEINVDGGADGVNANSPVFFDAGNGLSFIGDFTAGDGGRSVFFAGNGDFYVEEGGSVSTGNNLMLVKANDIDLQGSLYGAGIVIRASTGRTIGIDGNATSSQKSNICGEECGMTISQSEIDNMHSQFDDDGEISPRGIEIGNSRAGALTVDDINLNDNLFALVSGSTINDFDDEGPNIITSWGLVLRAGGDIGNLTDEGLNVDAGFVTFSNGANDNFKATNLNSAGDDTFFGAVTDGTGNISYTLENGNLLVDQVSTQGDVNLEASTGAILDANDGDIPDSPGNTNVQGDNVILTAQNGIGEANNVLEVEANSLTTTNTGSPDNVHVTNNGVVPGTFTPEQEDDIDQGQNSTFLTQFFENVADNSGC